MRKTDNLALSFYRIPARRLLSLPARSRWRPSNPLLPVVLPFLALVLFNLNGIRAAAPFAAFSGCRLNTIFFHDKDIVRPDITGMIPAPVVSNDGVCQFGSSPRNGGLRAVCGICSDGAQPRITWWSAAVGGIPIGVGALFNPLIAGFVDPNFASQTTFYAQCECSDGVSARVAGVFSVYAVSSIKIAGPGLVCPQANSGYIISGALSTSTYAWTLSGGGALTQISPSSAAVQWKNLYNGDGPFSVKATETTANGCIQTVEQIVYIRQTALAGIGNLNVSLNVNCVAGLRVEDLLVGARTGASDMKLQLIRGDGYVFESGVDSILVDGVDPLGLPYLYKGKTLQYKITEPCSGSVCTGYILFQNKQAPLASCPPDVTLSCVQIPASVSPLASLTGMPQVSDCTPASINYRDVTYDQNCSAPFTSLPSGIGSAHTFPPFNDIIQVIDRIFTLTTTAGTSSTCEQLIFIRKANINHILCPPDATFNCTESADLTPKTTGYPIYDIDGDFLTQGDRYPLTASICNLAVSYEDKTVPLCKGSFQIWRTWTIVDVCSNAAPKTCLQTIKVLDKTPPTVRASFTQFYADPVTRSLASVDTSVVFDGYFIQNGAQSAGTLQDVWALGSAGDCGGKAIFTLVAKDPNCTGGPVTVSANDTRIVLRNAASFNASTGETTFVFDAIYGQQGDFTATFTAADACGYALAKKTFIVHVRDNIKPAPACVQTLKVSISSDGTASIYARAFDEGSSDNCGISSLQVRRISVSDVNGLQIANPDPAFYDQVIFDCRDLTPASILIAMRVTDYAGNFNDCMVQAIVENKIHPTCIAPADKKISCTQLDSAGLESLGRAVFTDNCGVHDTVYAVVQSLDNCKTGTIVRRWVATGQTGLKDSCSQTITITPVSDFTVDFPDDLILTCFSDVISADSLRNRMLNNPPTADGHIVNNGCGVIGVQVKDDTIIGAPDACFKILRRIAVIDWCKYNINNSSVIFTGVCYGQPLAGDVHSDSAWATHNQPAWQNLPRPVGVTPRDRLFRDADGIVAPGYDPKAPGAVNSYSDGIVCYTQIIKIIDTVPPVVVCPPNKTVNDLSASGCLALFNDTLRASDFCKGGQPSGSPLTYHWTMTAPDGTTVLSGGAQILQASLAYKIPYKINWQVVDACGNTAFCAYTVTARDAKKPTIICRDINASLARMADGTGRATVMATDLLASNLSDNCTAVDSLNKRLVVVKASESAHTYPVAVAGKDFKSISFTCDDQDKTVPVELWTMDDAGNADFCVAHVTVQDNLQQACRTIIQSAVVSGDVETENQQTVQHTTVTAHDASGAWASEYSTLADGVFSVANLRLGQTYQITAANNELPLNGVTTFDIALVSKHILGVQLLNSPYKLIAADVNRDGDISAVDMLQMRKLILHIIPAFPNNSSWRFVDKKYVFQYPDNPFAEDFRENIALMNIPANAQANFIGIKIGDVNGTAHPNGLVNTETRHAFSALKIQAEDRMLEAGKTDTLHLTAEAFSAAGFQFTLHFNNAEVLEIIPGDLPNFSDANVGIFKNDLTISWNGATGGGNPAMLFSVVLKAKKSGPLSATTTLGSNLTLAEAYAANGEPQAVRLQFRSAANDAFALYPNQPNPFDDATRIGFSLPNAEPAKLTVFDATGRLLYMQQNNFQQGYNEIRLNADALSAQGVLFYRLDAGGQSAVRKMIKIE